MPMSDAEFDRWRERAFRFLWEEVAPLEPEIERTGRIPIERLWPRFAEEGFLALQVPRQYGGLELAEHQYLQVEKEWSKVHGGVRTILHVHNLGTEMLRYARPDQQADLYPKVARGEASIAFALTEPIGGTGKDIHTRARRDGDEFVINGVKHLITNADFATHFNLVCWTEGPDGQWRISNLLVERGRPGFSIRVMPPTMGTRGAMHGRLVFQDCRVPVSNLLGEEGRGLETALHTLTVSRVRIAATALGTMERCLDLAVAFAQRRVTFGQPIAQRQAVQRYLAEMAVDIYALQCALEDTARAIEAGEDIQLKANLVKLLAIEAERRVTDNAILVFGGIGYTQEYPVERLYRDARLNWFEEGTPTILMLVIARRLLEGERTYRRWHEETFEMPLERALQAPEAPPSFLERHG